MKEINRIELTVHLNTSLAGLVCILPVGVFPFGAPPHLGKDVSQETQAPTTQHQKTTGKKRKSFNSLNQSNLVC